MRAALTIVAAAILLTTAAIAQAPARVGALIGIRSNAPLSGDVDGKSSTYRTYWIVKDDGRVQLAASADNLIVPRPDGFWRIGSRVVKWRDNYSVEYVWASSALGRPIIASDDDEGCSGCVFSPIVFVLDKYVASARGVDSLASIRDREASLAGSVSISEMFGVPGTRALRISKVKNPDDLRWTIVRSRGRFQVYGFNQPLPLTPTTKQIGWHSSPVDWPAVQKAVSDATDAFRSARGDLLIVVAPKEILAFTPSATAFGDAKLRVPLADSDNRAVMAEWATGVYVQRWTMAVNTLANQQLPRVVRETPKQ